jgi:glycerophosphoryl diester phosphodiesterase
MLGGLGAVLGTAGSLGSVKFFASASPPTTRPAVIGHRGAGGIEPPNTIAGVRRALDLGVDGIELDVRETSDGELVLYHDPVLDWDSTGTGWIENTPLSEVQAARIGGEPVPTLSAALDVLDERDVEVELYLEVKSTGYTDTVVETVEEYGYEDLLTVVSFSEDVLARAQELDVPTGFLGGVIRPGVVDSATESGAGAVLCHYTPFLTSWFTDEAEAAELTSGVWKLGDTEQTIQNSLSAEPDVIVTNRPDLVFEQLESA